MENDNRELMECLAHCDPLDLDCVYCCFVHRKADICARREHYEVEEEP